MKKGQSTLDYVLLIGVFAAALIAMLVYVSRGMQGNLRNNAEKIGAMQYDPGNTHISNSETKKSTVRQASGSSSTVTYGDTYKKDPDMEAKLEEIQKKQAELAKLQDGTYTDEDVTALKGSGYTDSQIAALKGGYERVLMSEATEEAEEALYSNTYPWGPLPAEGGIVSYYEDTRESLVISVNSLSDEYEAMEEAWKNREITPDKTSSGSYSSESGTTSNNKSTNETLGNL
jgi:hypothetical protein